MATPITRRDVRAHQESVTLTGADIVGRLRDVLGLALVAYLGEVKETRAAAQWAAGERKPSTAVLTRLRTAYQAAALLEADGANGAGVHGPSNHRCGGARAVKPSSTGSIWWSRAVNKDIPTAA